jgi:hypothetical protein
MPPVFDGVGDPGIGIHNEIVHCCVDTEFGGSAVATFFGQGFDEALPRLRPVSLRV